MGTEIQRVPSGDISTLLSTPSRVATNEEVPAEERNESASEDTPFTRGIALTDSVPKAKLVTPEDSGLKNVPAEVGTIHTKELSVLEILTDWVPTPKPSG